MTYLLTVILGIHGAIIGLGIGEVSIILILIYEMYVSRQKKNINEYD
jgi:Na+-driven multidrug efflux pump